MTRQDTKRILERICRLYIIQAKKLSREEISAMVDSWEETFKSDSYDDVDNAVSLYIRGGKPFMPNTADIINIMNAVTSAPSRSSYSEADKLFKRLADMADILANNKERRSIVDPGGYRWNEELQRDVYHHPEVLISTKSFTQYDFAQLPIEIQEYVEDIEGLRSIWREIQSNRSMAKRRFEMQLPQIKEEIAKRNDKNSAENKQHLEVLFRKMENRLRGAS